MAATTMQKKLHFLLFDTSQTIYQLCQSLLEAEGHTVSHAVSKQKNAAEVLSIKPDCIISDLSTPDTTSLALLEEIRKLPNISQPVFIAMIDNKMAVDYPRVFAIGVSGYVSTPINASDFVEKTLAACTGEMRIQCWGSRGTLPVPGNETTRYGGNTNCITVNIAKNHFFIFDGGTGLKELSDYLLREKKLPLSAKIFFTHPHYDHIQGVPFFVPFYMPGNKFEIFGMTHGGHTIEDLIAGQMDSVYFPVTIKEFGSQLTFRNLNVETIYIDDVQIKTTILTHPGKAMGYRVQYLNKTFCYATDNELYLTDSPLYQQTDVDSLIDFIRDVDVLFIDCTYSDEAYPRKVGWGHSSASRVIDIAHKANVKLLCLHHHDPDQTDADIDAKLAIAISLLKARNSKTECMAAKEGEVLNI
jgi:phosphoribosyl 1,2-cyclic phosphodiesterase